MKIRSCGEIYEVLAEHLTLIGKEYLIRDSRTGQMYGVLAHLVHIEKEN